MLRTLAAVSAGKAARLATRLRGGGSAFPGLVAEKIDPRFLATALSAVPGGIVVVSGTNGKTTTTKMLAEILRAHGRRVFSNPTGSNFTRGVISSLLGDVGLGGKVKADIAVVELDEAHSLVFARAVAPTHALLLNVARDQLDRFAEIDHTAALLGRLAAQTTTGLVLNRDDSFIARLADEVGGHTSDMGGAGRTSPAGPTPTRSTSDGPTAGATTAGATPAGATPAGATTAGATPAGATPAGATPAGSTPAGSTTARSTPAGPSVRYFGVHPSIADRLPELLETDLRADDLPTPTLGVFDGLLRPEDEHAFEVAFADGTVVGPMELRQRGLAAMINATAATTMARMLLGADFDVATTESALRTVAPPFGRGEVVDADGQPLELVLVKNPAGFTVALSTYGASPVTTMIAINDDYADGRDVSWLYDVSFDSLAQRGVALTSGVRAYDMALRLHYDGIVTDSVEPDLERALGAFLASYGDVPKRIFCTYTAMLTLRRMLAARYGLAAMGEDPAAKEARP